MYQNQMQGGYVSVR